MKLTDKIEITNEDNMELMARYPDNYFELAIVDPPYGIGVHGNKEQRREDGSLKRKAHKLKSWDSEIPKKEYFDELFRVSKNHIIWGFRVSKNHIIWGGNYFTEFLQPTKSWVFWYKAQQGLTMSDGELAWTSLKKVTRMYTLHRTHLWQEKPQHPTQKPVKLYEWLLDNYAKEGDKILDTHLGSGSIAIACHNLGFDLTACELDKDYYEASIKRIQNHVNQLQLFL
jgi:site-specific DNA-methyltransferase (adenine-specific)